MWKNLIALSLALVASQANSQKAWAAETKLVLVNPANNRELPLQIYYPIQNTPAPVVVFSHGIGASGDNYRYIGEHLASQGFISIHPTHKGIDASAFEYGFGRMNMARFVMIENDPDLRVLLPSEISFVIDSLSSISKQLPGFNSKIDRSRIAVGGHSWGSFISMVVAGAQINFQFDEANLFDPRIKAAFALSPEGVSRFFNTNAWRGMHIPILMVTGDQDIAFGAEYNYAWRRGMFEKIAPGHKHLLSIEGARHLSFADLSEDNDAIDFRVRAITKQAVTLFLQTYLNDDREAKSQFDSGAFSKRYTGHYLLESK